MIPLGQWVEAATACLQAAGVESARTEALVLSGHVLGHDRSWALAHPEAPMPMAAAESLIERRLNHEPLAYLVGYKEFYGRRFTVDRRVLIPRPETESVVEGVLERFGTESLHVLDLCTGSGCIAITLKLERPSWNVVGTDLSLDALEVAQQNATCLGADITWRHGDLFASVHDATFDLVVTNPPYIAPADPLPVEVSAFEPSLALYGGGDGFDIFRRIATESPSRMAEGGSLVLEVGDGHAESVKSLFARYGWRWMWGKRDLLGSERGLAFQVDRELHADSRVVP